MCFPRINCSKHMAILSYDKLSCAVIQVVLEKFLLQMAEAVDHRYTSAPKDALKLWSFSCFFCVFL